MNSVNKHDPLSCGRGLFFGSLSLFDGHLSCVSPEGNGIMKSFQVNRGPPIKLSGLSDGVKYRLRVYSHEHHSISSDYVTFETGEGWPRHKEGLRKGAQRDLQHLN